MCISDHGGHGYHHARGTEVDVVIPFLLWGKGILRGHRIDSAVTTLNVAPTLARLLGISAPAAWQGGVVSEALDGDPSR